MLPLFFDFHFNVILFKFKVMRVLCLILLISPTNFICYYCVEYFLGRLKGTDNPIGFLSSDASLQSNYLTFFMILTWILRLASKKYTKIIVIKTITN